MSDNIPNDKPSKFVRISNTILLIFNLLIASEVIVLIFSRTTFAEISNSIFSPDKPLMDSVILDLLLRKGMIFLIIPFLLWIIGKEIRIKSIKRRLQLNLAAFLGLAAYNGLLFYLIYLPVIQAV